MKVIIKHRYGDFEKEVNPKFTKGKIHIYGGGTSGYKLSIGDRSLTLAELVSVVEFYNTNFQS